MRPFALLLLIGCAGTPSNTHDTGGVEDTGSMEETGQEQVFPQITGGDSPSAQFSLAFDSILDADEDGAWEIGEAATLQVMMTNHGEDDFAYPGCELRSDDLGSGQGEWPFFGISAGDSNLCSFTMEHRASAQPGDVVEVEVIVDRLHCEETGDCPEENPLVLRFQLVESD